MVSGRRFEASRQFLADYDAKGRARYKTPPQRQLPLWIGVSRVNLAVCLLMVRADCERASATRPLGRQPAARGGASYVE